MRITNKALTWLLFSLLFQISQTQAQITLATRGGINLNDFAEKISVVQVDSDNKEVFSSSSNIGYHYGIEASLKATSKVSFQSGLYLTQRGMGRNNARLNIHYLDLPLIMQYHLSEKLSAGVGPVLSYRLWAQGYPHNNDKKEDITEMFRPFSFGLQAGLSFDVTDNIAVTASYYHGMAYTFDINYRDINNAPAGTIKYFNRNLSIGTSYRFR